MTSSRSFTPEPGQLLGEERDALAVAAEHAGDVGAPEHALGPERVEDSMQPVLDVAERIILRRIMRRAGGLDRDIGQLRQRHQFVEMDKGLGIAAKPVEAAMIEDHPQIGMTLGDLAKFRQEDTAHHGDRQAFLFGRRP